MKHLARSVSISKKGGGPNNIESSSADWLNYIKNSKKSKLLFKQVLMSIETVELYFSIKRKGTK